MTAYLCFSCCVFFFSSRRRHTRCALVTGVHTCALPISVGTDRCDATRVYILREPTFNATMSPNGTMRVYSGLLLRVRSEAGLAAVLGHEFGHFEKRHALMQFKAARGGSDLLAWSALLASMSPRYNTKRAYQDMKISVYGSFFRFGRDQERRSEEPT